MTFAVTADALKNATITGTELRLNQAISLITKHVDKQLSAHVAKVQAGEIASKDFRIIVETSVSKDSEQHVPAMKAVVAELSASGFKAEYGEVPAEYDGLSSSQEYAYIGINLG